MAPTLIVIDGFEYGFVPFATTSIGGGGVGTSVATPGDITCDSTVKRSGTYSLKITQQGVAATRLVKTFAAPASNILVGAFYYRATAAPVTASNIMNTTPGTGNFRIETDGKLSALFTSGTAQTTAASVVDSAWHLIDFKLDVSANPNRLDWKVDGVAQTQATRALAATTVTTVGLGSAATTANHTYWLDDLVLSGTGADYPIGSTTVPHSVLAVLPTGDGTHNAGTNTIEDQAGTDIVSPNANGRLSTWIPTTSAYIRQATIDTTAYAEVTFANHDSGIGTIWDVAPLLAYSSSTNAVNEGACVVSYDNFTTPLEVYGTASARTDYNGGSGTPILFKTKNAATVDGIITRPAATWDLTSFDALKARVGYSGDVTGNPRWFGLLLQYAGTAAGVSSGETEFVGTIPI